MKYYRNQHYEGKDIDILNENFMIFYMVISI